MNLTLLLGTRIVVGALVAYSIAIFTEQKKWQITRTMLFFLTLGIFLDVTATICMIIGSPNSPFTLHGFLGYSALTGMLIDGVAAWRFRLLHLETTPTPRALHLYSRYAYIWWLAAFITGGALIFFK
jgi:hypothetical protein